jgi:signal transduction histidine kinase
MSTQIPARARDLHEPLRAWQCSRLVRAIAAVTPAATQSMVTLIHVAEIPKSSEERAQTDDSLRDERDTTDRAITEVQENADDLLRGFRHEADEQLHEARERADQLLAANADTMSADKAVAMERDLEDAALRDDRDAADETIELERAETARILARLLPAEREQTDHHLNAERVQSDGALANRDDFLGVVAHDLRDLLGGVVVSASVIAKVVGATEHAPRVNAEIARIQRHTARANRLIADLVDIASIDAGRLSMLPRPGDLQALLCEAGDEFRPSAAAKNIDLVVDDGRIALPAEFDHARLFQVIGNLIANAIKFSSGGTRIALRAQRSGDHVQCMVSDQGAGIPADQIEKVFERFVQVNDDDRRGLGLGLFIAKRIVEGHSGRIWAESTRGQGTSVLFTIPIHRGPVPGTTARA